MSPQRAETEINRRSVVRSSLLYQYETAATNRQVASIVCIPGISFIWFSATYSDRQNVLNDSRLRQSGPERDNTVTVLSSMYTSTRAPLNGPMIQRESIVSALSSFQQAGTKRVHCGTVYDCQHAKWETVREAANASTCQLFEPNPFIWVDRESRPALTDLFRLL